MNETDYHRLVDTTLGHYAEMLEPAFEQGALDDIELQGGVLTLKTAGGTTLVVSKHTASQQLWLASPVSGGLHFSYAPATDDWRLPDGRSSHEILRQELALHGIEVHL